VDADGVAEGFDVAEDRRDDRRHCIGILPLEDRARKGLGRSMTRAHVVVGVWSAHVVALLGAHQLQGREGKMGNRSPEIACAGKKWFAHRSSRATCWRSREA
jgi:hypothetical protein